MLEGYIVGLSVLTQLITVYLALRLIKVTQDRVSWGLISSAIFFMAVRRAISLFWFVIGDQSHRPDLSFETAGLVTSFLMLAGVIWISPLFKSMSDEIVARRRAEEAMRASEKKLKNITSSLGEGIYVYNEHGEIVFMNPEAERLLGWTMEELNEKGAHDLVHFRKPDGTQLPFEECSMHRVVKTGKPYSSMNELFVRKDGTAFPISVVTTPIIEDGKVIASVTAFRDITDRKQLEIMIMHQAYHDSLTGLPNRNLFIDHLSHEIAEARRNRKKLAVLLLDLDGFKKINDTLGHAVGDKILHEAALRIKACIRESDIVARMGGDEFNILQPDVNHASDAAVIAEKILAAFREPHIVEGSELRILTSIGISVYPQDGEHIDALLRNADTAMYRAKESGGDRFFFFNAGINSGRQDL
ncbi:MAG: GGDEF domain-containing protein [Nitrospirae bacterium]|nr:GGDEF domain-containing protein [Nitrospirota bacterium]